MLDWLWDWLSTIWDQVTAWFGDIVQAVFGWFMDAVVVVLSAIPVPTWAEGLTLDWVPPAMAYFLAPFNVGFGLTCIGFGYLWRFVIRRLPVVG